MARLQIEYVREKGPDIFSSTADFGMRSLLKRFPKKHEVGLDGTGRFLKKRCETLDTPTEKQPTLKAVSDA